ncbi:hypothetical protein NIES267_73430 (plasmid) [Calothrix parasitica NIES-267]|uniref:Uncharacterized protein n=1 Tax=Calothrix parasitica NIES-267 TaxID=1973488 RepID=A0A1Z4M2W4_9CYAN|nr:hypothetical protein NIES267_73430 [Calothrix parasitica NIES-267]
MPTEIEVDKIRFFEDEELLMSTGFIVDWFILYYKKNNSADSFIKKISDIYEKYNGLLFFYLNHQCYFIEPDPDKFFDLLLDDLERNKNRNITDELKTRIARNKKRFFEDNPDLVQGIILD